MMTRSSVRSSSGPRGPSVSASHPISAPSQQASTDTYASSQDNASSPLPSAGDEDLNITDNQNLVSSPLASIDESGPVLRPRRGKYLSSSVAPPLDKSPDISVVAVYGSAPASPVIRGTKRGSEVRDDQDFLPGPKRAPSDGEWVEKPLKDGPRPRPYPTRHAALNCDAAPKTPGDAKRVIALDFGDVCIVKNQAHLDLINAQEGLNLTLQDLKSYYAHQNPGWGSFADLTRKIRQFESRLLQAPPVPGLVDGLTALHQLGHEIHIVSSRPPNELAETRDWLYKYGITVGDGPDDVVRKVWLLGVYESALEAIPDKDLKTEEGRQREQELNDKFREVWRDVGKGKGGQGKLRVLREIGASVFIDDHYGNLVPAVTADPPIQCVLFGAYPWNRYSTSMKTDEDMMTYDERVQAGVELAKTPIEPNENLVRCESWEEVVNWIKATDAADK